MGKTDKRFERLEKELEPIILPLCAMYQENSKTLTRDERKARAEKCTSAYDLLLNYIKSTPQFNYNGEVLFEVMEKCLKIYKPQGKSFAKLFFKRYASRKVPNLRLEDEFERDNSKAERNDIRDKLRNFIHDNKGIAKPEITNAIHDFFGKTNIFSAESRKKFLGEKYCFEEEDVECFEQSLSSSGLVVHIDEKFMETEEDRKDQQSDFCISVIEKAFSMAEDIEMKRNLKYFLTEHALEVMQKEEIKATIEPYIDKDYLLLHYTDDFSAAFQDALAIAKEQGKSIQEDAFFKTCRRIEMAKYLGWEPDTWRKKEKQAEKLLSEAALCCGYLK